MLGPKLLGTYELEILPFVRAIIDGDYSQVIDVGAAEGYYAVGLLYANSNLRVACYDIDANSHPLVETLASANRCAERLESHGEFTDSELARLRVAEHRTALIIDVDGAELAILEPSREPLLLHCDILVETHDYYVAGTTDLLIRRFSASHAIDRIPSRRRRLGDLPSVSALNRRELLQLADEHRPGQEWLWMTVKRRGDGSR